MVNIKEKFSNWKKYRTKECWQDTLFHVINTILLLFLLVIVLYPLIYVLSCSFSDGDALMQGQVTFLPVKPTLEGYKLIFAYRPIWIGYRNSIFYAIACTFLGVALTMLAAFPLSRKELPFRGFFTTLFLITMFFSGGLIPKYILVMNNLNLADSIWAIILPGGISAYNMIIARTFIQNSIPEELYEASSIDGCGYFRYFIMMVLPLSKAIIAVLALWIAVGSWNAYFEPMLYINSADKMPLQVVLRKVLNTSGEIDTSVSDAYEKERVQTMIQYCSIAVASLPLMAMYPFLQKYFVKGVMIGSVKG